MSDIKITKERIDALLGEADIRTLTLFGKCTVVTAKLKNGFVLTADSACVDPANYEKRMGERICLEHIANKLWELEGYRLQWDVFNKANRKGTAPGLDDETLDEMRTLCSRALRAWGAEMQSVVAAEELSELQKELCKSVRGEDNADAIAEEIADVQIMLEQLGLYEHQVLSPAKIEQFQKLRTRLKGAREIVELANECGRQVCDEARHFACPFGDESMENCALRLEAKYDETIGLLLDLAEMMG